MSDYPHLRGEHSSEASTSPARCGPSPRAWGARRSHRPSASSEPDHPHVRGEHRACTLVVKPEPDHPHVRGEHDAVLVELAREQRTIPTCVGSTDVCAASARLGRGPSPRAWGAQAAADEVRVRVGPSPRAWGARGQRLRPAAVRADHPHVRGEHGPRLLQRASRADHPHVRGEHARVVSAPGSRRTIPTCVGSTEVHVSSRAPCGPSPRAWGAPSDSTSGHGSGCGPSPRAWGALSRRAGVSASARTIPTCVGSTHVRRLEDADVGGPSPRAWGARCPREYRAAAPDHPHVRGEHAPTSLSALGSRGPSPRAWGAPESRRRAAYGIGPSPRAWGAHCSRDRPLDGSCGPSPRAWGARRAATISRREHRTIPTCVGSTRHRSVEAQNDRTIPTCVGSTQPSSPHRGLVGGPSPRAWGARNARRAVGARGPSPRAWGALRHAASQDRCPDHPHVRGEHDVGLPNVPGRRRTIPTCVGSTVMQPGSSHWVRTIPTCVGSTRSGSASAPHHGGPSPRAWGAPGVPTGLDQVRTIPTCVGSTPGGAHERLTPTDHPHVRGEHPTRSQRDSRAPDHPHVRGEHRR